MSVHVVYSYRSTTAGTLKPANGVSHVSVSVNRNEFGITTIDTHHEASEMLSVMCGDDDLAVRSTKRALETSAARGTLKPANGTAGSGRTGVHPWDL